MATEVSLKGGIKHRDLGKLSIHGNADLLLELPGNRLFEVDYKNPPARIAAYV